MKQVPLTILKLALVMYTLGTFVFLALAIFLDQPFPLLWGWLLGSVISLINYGIIMLQAKRLQAKVALKLPIVGSGSGYMMARLLFFAVGMLASAFITIDGETNSIFNVFTLFGAYMVISAVIYMSGLQYKLAASKGQQS